MRAITWLDERYRSDPETCELVRSAMAGRTLAASSPLRPYSRWGDDRMIEIVRPVVVEAGDQPLPLPAVRVIARVRPDSWLVKAILDALYAVAGSTPYVREALADIRYVAQQVPYSVGAVLAAAAGKLPADDPRLTKVLEVALDRIGVVEFDGGWVAVEPPCRPVEWGYGTRFCPSNRAENATVYGATPAAFVSIAEGIHEAVGLRLFELPNGKHVLGVSTDPLPDGSNP